MGEPKTPERQNPNDSYRIIRRSMGGIGKDKSPQKIRTRTPRRRSFDRAGKYRFYAGGESYYLFNLSESENKGRKPALSVKQCLSSEIKEYRDIEIKPDRLLPNKRMITQQQVKKGTAKDYAKKLGFCKGRGGKWVWAHLVAHGLGGLDNRGPQVPENLVLATHECNVHMEIFERKLIKLLKDVTVPMLLLDVVIYSLPQAADVLRKIEYTIKIPSLNKTFFAEFVPLSRANPRGEGKRLIKDAFDRHISSQENGSSEMQKEATDINLYEISDDDCLLDSEWPIPDSDATLSFSP